jgi:Ni/Co efflux regulator RcnB
MKHPWTSAGFAVLLACGIAASGPVYADKPNGGHNKHEKSHSKHDRDEGEDRNGGGAGGAVAFRFDSDARTAIADYYGAQVRAGKCPPGLAKKNNGCQPPGQAKKWHVGQPLPADLRYASLPSDLLRRLPPPPPKHRYVQVAGDVLMIAVGTSMVVDAVEDILR